MLKRRVLLVDLDPQGNATMGAGIDKRALTCSVYQVLLGERKIADARVSAAEGGFDVVPARGRRELGSSKQERLTSLGRGSRRWV